jgi:hypothetical protein
MLMAKGLCPQLNLTQKLATHNLHADITNSIIFREDTMTVH